MTQYTVDVWMEISNGYMVEADSEEEAVEKAKEKARCEHFSATLLETQVI